MPEESTTPDLVELALQGTEALNRDARDEWASGFAPDAVYDTGAGRFEGRAAIRAYIEDFRGSFDEITFENLEVRDLANGVLHTRSVARGRPRGSSAHVEVRSATNYSDPDEARAAAERLAQERG